MGYGLHKTLFVIAYTHTNERFQSRSYLALSLAFWLQVIPNI